MTIKNNMDLNYEEQLDIVITRLIRYKSSRINPNELKEIISTLDLLREQEIEARYREYNVLLESERQRKK